MHTKKAVHGCVTCSAKMIALVPYEGWLEGWVDGFGEAILIFSGCRARFTMHRTAAPQ